MIESLRESPETIAELSAILIDATADGKSVGFLHPLAPAKAAAYWRDSFAQVAAGRRIVLGARDGGRIVGTATLAFATLENQTHRADVQKLLVLVSHRRRGIGERLMLELEARARAAGKSLLVLDTATPEAARLYERMDWRLTGEIPDYALYPNGEPCATAIYWKAVRAE